MNEPCGRARSRKHYCEEAHFRILTTHPLPYEYILTYPLPFILTTHPLPTHRGHRDGAVCAPLLHRVSYSGDSLATPLERMNVRVTNSLTLTCILMPSHSISRVHASICTCAYTQACTRYLYGRSTPPLPGRRCLDARCRPRCRGCGTAPMRSLLRCWSSSACLALRA